MATLTRISTVSEDIGAIARRYDPRFREARFGMGDVTKYGLYVHGAEPYLIMISKRRDGAPIVAPYNFVATITSDRETLNFDLAKSFTERTGVVLQDAPRVVALGSGLIDMVFQSFKRGGGRAMDSLG